MYVSKTLHVPSKPEAFSMTWVMKDTELHHWYLLSLMRSYLDLKLCLPLQGRRDDCLMAGLWVPTPVLPTPHGGNVLLPIGC